MNAWFYLLLMCCFLLEVVLSILTVPLLIGCIGIALVLQVYLDIDQVLVQNDIDVMSHVIHRHYMLMM